MEATKKKKAYLKPEMTKFEMKTEGFIAASNFVDIVIPPTTDPEKPSEVEIDGLLSQECTGDGNVTNLGIDDCGIYKTNIFNKDGKCPLWDMIEKAGLPLKSNEDLYIKRTATNKYRVRKENICN